MKRRMHTPRRGLTLVELMIALAITLVIGAALAAVLTTISRVTEHDRDTRTASLRSHAVQIRLQAYSDSGLCVLQTSGSGDFVVWLEDADSGASVNPSEVRVFTVEEDGRLLCEWFEPPEALTPEELEVADAPVPAATDFFTLMKAKRAARQTQQAVIADGLTAATLSHDTATPMDATRVRYAFQQTFPSGTSSDSLIALAFQQHTTPEF